MLNRLYIVVGLLVILLLGGAFIVPSFYDWSDRRDQLEALASEALGTDVQVAGEIDFGLLPQPRLRFTNVVIGPPDSPFAEISAADAEFSLMDFLRDRYNVTRLVLEKPRLRLLVDQDGALQAPFVLPETVSASNVSIADAEIEDGLVRLSDARSGNSWVVSAFTGSVKLSALRGPFALQGSGNYDAQPYQVRVTTSDLNAAGDMQMSAFVRPVAGGFSLSAEGQMATGAKPSFKGKLQYRQTPPEADNVDQVRGDMTLEAEIEADSRQVLLSNYTLSPDANRAGTRLTGAAVLHLDADPNYNAVISGGVVALAPRDAREETGAEPYELVRLLNELSAAPVPPLPGRIGVDINELNLRAFSLRNLRLDATSDAGGWQIENLSGRLPGDSAFGLTGKLTAVEGKPQFDGSMSLSSTRLDALAQLWRKPDDSNVLFGQEADLQTHVVLGDGRLALSEGAFTLDSVENAFSGDMTLSGDGEINIQAALGILDAEQSDALMALLPDIAGGNEFAASFVGGSFDLKAEQMRLFGLDGQQLATRGTWNGSKWNFSQLAAVQLGGTSFSLFGNADIKTGADGALAPIVTGSGRVILHDNAADEALPVFYDLVGVDASVRNFLAQWSLANFQIDLKQPDADGGQDLVVDGTASIADFRLGAAMTRGIAHAFNAPIGARLELTTKGLGPLAEQMGLGDPGFGDSPDTTKLIVLAEGSPSNSMDVQVTVQAPEDRIQYTGDMIVSDLTQLRGRGQLEFDIVDPSPWAGLMGAAGLYLPPLAGVGDISFTQDTNINLTSLNLNADGANVTGDLARTRQGGGDLFSGTLATDKISLDGLTAVLAGASSLSAGAVWPEGVFAETGADRESRGRVKVNTPQVVSGTAVLARDAAFDLVWDNTNVRVRGFEAAIGAGKVRLDASICCTGVLAAKQLAARVNFDNVPVDQILPKQVSDYAHGNVTGAMRLEATGQSFAEAVSTMNGEGSFNISDLSIAHFNSDVFATAASVDDIVNMDADALKILLEGALNDGPFVADEMSGAFNVAGGVIRASNLAAENEAARLFGGLNVDFNDLGLDGDWDLSPIGTVGDSGLIDENTSRIAAHLNGALKDPQRTFDLAPMVDAIKVQAYELEVERLEKLRAEQEARAKAAAEERARVMAEEARQKAEAAVKAEQDRRAKEDAAAAARQKAAEEEAIRRAEENDTTIDDLFKDGDSQDPLLQDGPVDLIPNDGQTFTLPDESFTGNQSLF